MRYHVLMSYGKELWATCTKSPKAALFAMGYLVLMLGLMVLNLGIGFSVVYSIISD
jgi:hypothetical protein